MTITTIIPVYNSRDTVVEAVRSVLDQDLPVAGATLGDIIVVDDASPDDSSTVLADSLRSWGFLPATPEVAPRCSATRWSHPDNPSVILARATTNGGPAAARNIGASLTSSPTPLTPDACPLTTDNWLAFLDADDRWLPHKLCRQCAVLRQDDALALVCGMSCSLDEVPVVAEATPAIELIPLEEFVFSNRVGTSSVLVRRDAFDECEGFDESFRGPEDYDLWMRIAARRPMGFQPEKLFAYRHESGSLSMDDRTFLPEVLRVLEKAFAPDGVLHQYAHLKRRAFAQQYAGASWMAHNRGDNVTALRLLWRSWRYSVWGVPKERADPLLRVKLLMRYLRG